MAKKGRASVLNQTTVGAWEIRGMNLLVTVSSFATLLALAILLHTSIKDFLWVHPWWHSFFVALPTLALGVFEIHHSREANRLRAELDAERNEHLQQIARNTARPPTQAERNAETLRKHIRKQVTVTEGSTSWGNTPEIVEVSGDNIVTLFTPHGYSSSTACLVQVHCGDLEITQIPQGSSPLRVRVLKRYGDVVQLGEIKKWEDRFQPVAGPTFAKGGTAYHATYSKPGSSENRNLYVYASSDATNSFLLEASTGERITGDNTEISKRFMVLQIDYEAAGFQRATSGSGGGSYRLYVR